MAWVNVVHAEAADDDLARAYEILGIDNGSIGPPYEGLTNNGPVLLSLLHLSRAARFGPSPLTRLQREMIATVVSAINHCVF
jgi:alkylhydroperoxidase family enzyme